MSILFTPSQVRAACGLLDWSATDLAEKIGVSKQMMSAYLSGKSGLSFQNIQKIAHALDIEGIEFTEDGGVKPNTNRISIYRGTEGFAAFFDNVYDTANSKEDPNICVANADDKLFLQWHSTHAAEYIRKMGTLDIKPARSLLNKGDDFKAADKYSLYKWINLAIPSKSSLYLYGRKAAIINFQTDDVEITVVNNLSTTQMLRSMFEVLWEKASDTP
jgi:transcriptional regulator with XRE-family HTH domain